MENQTQNNHKKLFMYAGLALLGLTGLLIIMKKKKEIIPEESIDDKLDKKLKSLKDDISSDIDGKIKKIKLVKKKEKIENDEELEEIGEPVDL